MNRTIATLLCASGVAALAAASCAQEGQTDPGSGTSGGTMAGSTGNPTTGSGGSPMTVGSGGSNATSGGAGGDTSAAGGMAGSGTGGMAGSVGPGGAGGAGGGVAVTVESIVPTLDGFVWIGDCGAGSGSGKDCPILPDNGGACSTSADFFTRGAFKIKTHKVGGTAGTKYMINFEARGVTGGKEYTGGTRQSTAATFNQTGNDGWRVGGLATDSKWNTYEIHVTPPVPGQPVNMQNLTCAGCPTGADNIYYTNSIPNTDGVHETFPIKLKASFPVLGGGTITLVVHDSNCLGQQNCGPDPDPAAMCIQPPPNGPRTIDITGMSPQPPMFVQPYTQIHAPNPWYPQWLLFDVQSVTQM